jgi:predicted CXXCH cytochrome family protein
VLSGVVVRVHLVAFRIFVLLLGVFAFWYVGSFSASKTSDPVLPTRQDDGFVTSNACVACHPEQHASWHASFHRTMTQPANVETVLAPFNNIELKAEGYQARLQRRGDEYWVNTIDPEWENEKFAAWTQTLGQAVADPFTNFSGDPPRIDAQVVMTTGSHHFQAYWIRGKEGLDLWQFPWRYHIGEQRWIHRKDVFLAPPQWRPGMWFRVWNHQCSFCHSTGPYPGQNLETGVAEDTRIAELGIACESCHGPAEAHVRLHQDQALSPGNAIDPIVNPAKLDHQRSSEVCGACHSHFRHSDPLVNVHGPQYRPGKNLHHFGTLREPPDSLVVMSRFWADGTNRSGGREFSGMSESKCFLEGELACVSCHSMHNSDPNDQLSNVGVNNEACYQCHDDYRDQLAEHTHHAADSTGSQCYNCHMPHTNYALFKAIRSHQIDVPKVVPVESNSRPNACNLCHLDQTLDWTARHLQTWYGTPTRDLPDDERAIAASLLWALKGDAGQRVIAAWHFGWGPARAASGEDWLLPPIAILMQDPYAAVRWVAFDALRKDERLASTKFDFDAPVADRDQVAQEILRTWRPRTPLNPGRAARLLLLPDGQIDLNQQQGIISRRDERMMSGVE